MPLSGAPAFTAEPQEMPMQPTSMGPSVQLPLSASHDPHHQHHPHHHQTQQQQPPIRTQFATYTSAPPHHLSLSAPTGTASADNSLAVPRYIGDTNPRPSKSPRHASHQSITSSISNDTASGEYRYGRRRPTRPPAAARAPAATRRRRRRRRQPAERTPVPPAPARPHRGAGRTAGRVRAGRHGAASAAAAQSAAAAAGAAGGQAPPRDYFPSSQGWTTTAGEAGGRGRGRGQAVWIPRRRRRGGRTRVKQEAHGHAAGGQGQPGQGYGYAWNAA
ncbi:hypothetical protein NEMBOFW57_005225 [Staphylotrichum longicolle]|uniref:Uncharacterized protein n=1 Tax=Staphylotrichum longicolle TaxID=669026 RepID=A0AAD4EWB4_9PEZI|nr:hypothetical protein NEMBOFW57_005225 [Staphylotrichum longicolle]